MKRLAVALAALMVLSAPASAQWYGDRGYGRSYDRDDFYERRRGRDRDEDDYDRRRGRRFDEDDRDRRRDRRESPRSNDGGSRAGGTCVTPRGSCPTGQPVAVGTRCFCQTGEASATSGTVR